MNIDYIIQESINNIVAEIQSQQGQQQQQGQQGQQGQQQLSLKHSPKELVRTLKYIQNIFKQALNAIGYDQMTESITMRDMLIFERKVKNSRRNKSAQHWQPQQRQAQQQSSQQQQTSQKPQSQQQTSQQQSSQQQGQLNSQQDSIRFNMLYTHAHSSFNQLAQGVTAMIRKMDAVIKVYNGNVNEDVGRPIGFEYRNPMNAIEQGWNQGQQMGKELVNAFQQRTETSKQQQQLINQLYKDALILQKRIVKARSSVQSAIGQNSMAFKQKYAYLGGLYINFIDIANKINILTNYIEQATNELVKFLEN